MSSVEGVDWKKNPGYDERVAEGKARFAVFIYEHNEHEEPGWKYKLFLHDFKYLDCDDLPMESVAGGNSWAEAFARAGSMIDMAIHTTDRCIFV